MEQSNSRVTLYRNRALLFLILFFANAAFGQHFDQLQVSKLAVGNRTTPANSAAIDVISTTLGALLPRMTGTQRDAISSPATGLVIYNTDLNYYQTYNGAAWTSIGGNSVITDNTTSVSTVYPIWVSGTSGAQATNVSSTKLSFVPSTGALTAPSFIGALTGNASTVTTNANMTGDVTSVGNATTMASSISGAKTFSTSLTSPAFISSSSNPATTGLFRLANGDALVFRNNANSANISLAKDTSDQLSWAGTSFLSSSGVLLAAAHPALTGDVTNSAGSLSTTVAKIAGVAVGTPTGTGNVVFSNSPTLVTPALGTPSALVGTNITGTASGLTAGNVTTNANLTGDVTSVGNATSYNNTVPINKGGTNSTSVTTSPAASAWAGWDTNKNMSANSFVAGYATTVTAAGTTTLTVSSPGQQFFTGSTTQTVVLPVASTLVLGQSYLIANLSSGVVTVNSSGSNNVILLGATSSATVTCILASGTTAASWSAVGSASSPLNTKGDIYTFTTANVRHASPGDYGRMIPDAAQTDGWRNANYSNFQNGRPGKNYVQYADFENGATTGWALGTVGTLTNGLPTGTPTFGSGASGNLSISIVSSSLIAGFKSLSYASSAATTSGDMLASDALSIDPADQAKSLTVKFYYTVHTNGTTAAGFSGSSTNNYSWAVWDSTNSVWLTSAGNFCMTQTTGIGYCTGTIQTGATTATIRPVIYNNVASTSATTMYFDDFYVGPQVTAVGPAMTDTTSFTPTGSWVSNTTYTGNWRRVGESMEIQYYLAITGAPTSANLSVNMPSGFTVDTSKLLNTTAGNIVYDSQVRFLSAGSNNFAGQAIYESSSVIRLRYYLNTSGTNPQPTILNPITQAAPLTFANGDYVSIWVKVPVTGWSSQSAQSSDSSTSVVASASTGATATITGSYSDVTWTTTTDTSGAMGSILYTVPVTGWYDFTGSLYVGATSLSAGGGFLVSLFNATSATTLREKQYLFDLNVPENESLDFNFQSILLNAGTTVKIQVRTTGTVGTPVINSSSTLNYFSVARKSGPAILTTADPVGFTANSSSTSIAGDNTPHTVINGTVDFDKTGSYNSSTGVFTAPISGTYIFQAGWSPNAATADTVNNVFILEFLKNASIAYRAACPVTGTGSYVKYCNAPSPPIKMLAGDTMTLQAQSSLSSGAVTGAGSATYNFFGGYRIGN